MPSRIGLLQYRTRLTVSAAILALVLPIAGMSRVRRSAADTEVVFDMKSLGEANYCRKYSTDCLTGLKMSPDGKTAWIGSTMALLRFEGSKRTEFRREQLGAYCDSFRPLAFDARGKLWIALKCYTPREGVTIATYEGGTWTLLDESNFPAPEYARRPRLMAFDRNNVMWATTYAGLVRFDGKNWTLHTTENSPLPERDITALSIDAKGAVWMGTHDGHIARLDDTKWVVFKQGAKPPIGLYQGIPQSIRFDLNGTMYFTYYHERGVKKHVAGVFKDVSCPGISGDQEDIAFDAQNVLWIASSDRKHLNEPGLLRYDGPSCKKFLPDRHWSTSIQIDAAGNKWIATLEGSVIVFREGGVKLTQ
jgi:ligand-binding sensor domain-containing protein